MAASITIRFPGSGTVGPAKVTPTASGVYQCMLNPASTLVVVTPPSAGLST